MFYQNEFKDLVVKKENHLLWVSLDRDSHRNAFSIEMIKSLREVLEHADFDSQIRVIILTGSGKSFCAGGDLDSMEQKNGMFSGESFELSNNYRRYIQQIPKLMESIRTPMIAMVGGAAIGAGLDFACMCDLRIASTKAKFGETFANLSLVPGDGGSFFLQRIVGYAKAMELTLCADVIDANEAKDIGLITKLVEPAELESSTRELAHKLASKAPSALSFSKQAIKMAYEQNIHHHLEVLSAYQGISQRTSDHFEGIRAFREKRDPVFKGE